MNSPISLKELAETLGVGNDEVHQYLSLETGEIVIFSDEELRAVEDGHDLSDYADWQQEAIRVAQRALDNPETFIKLPTQFELNEYSIMEDYAYSVTNSAISEELHRALKGRRAFRRFKDTVRYHNLETSWYAYQDGRFAEIAKAWCDEHQIAYLDDHSKTR